MKIEEHEKQNGSFDIFSVYTLEFADPDSKDEAISNLEWVLLNDPSIESIAVVMRSYYEYVWEW